MTAEAWVGIAGAAIASIAALFALLQARSAKRSADSAESQLEQARIQADAARRQARAAEEQLNLMLREMEHTNLAEKASQLEREHQHLARLATAAALLGSTTLHALDEAEHSKLYALLNPALFSATIERFKEGWNQYGAQSTECRAQLTTPSAVAQLEKMDGAIQEFAQVCGAPSIELQRADEG